MGIGVLGPLTVDGDVGAPGPRDRVVLAALTVARGRVLSAEQLADALWGEAPPASSGKVVQGCVMRLRKVLGRQAIETSPHGYRLVVEGDDIDAARFEHLVGRARELLTLGEPERAAYAVAEALGLWRGRPLEEVESWAPARTEAGRLLELRLAAEELGVESALGAGRYQEVLAEAGRLVEEAPVRERRWALLALAQYQAGRQSEALRTLHRLRAVLVGELGIDPSPDVAALEQAILRQDPSLVAATGSVEQSATCPYRGLTPYEVTDTDAFFGREADVTDCLHRLGSTGVLVVVGPSGSGKSSLVRAGIAAARGRAGRSVVVVTPGPHPMDSLTAVPAHGPPPVLVVDQGEEVFSQCEDPAERDRFFVALAAHAERAELVVVLRADRMGEVVAHPDLARLVERGLYLLGAMAEDDLRAAISGPARQAGLLVEPGLVDLLVREVQGEPGALPLLSHALRETWLRREARTLTVAGYQDGGGIRGAVAQSAEQVFEQVGPRAQPLLRDLFLRLVAPAEGDPVRLRLPRRLVAGDAELEQLVELLVSARLVTSDDGVVELAHEALARAWPRLRGWLDDDTGGRRIQQHLTLAADAWQAMGRPDSELYGGTRLAEATDWRDRSAPRLTPTEAAFLDASHARLDEDLRTARQRAEREAVARRRTTRLAGVLAGVMVLALVAAGLAVRFQRDATARAGEATAATTLAEANRLAALSTSVSSLDLSLLLAAEAAQVADTPETRDGLLAALVEHRRAVRVVQVGAPVDELDLGDRGRTAFVDLGRTVVAWRVGSGSSPTEVHDWVNPGDIDASPTDAVVAAIDASDRGVEVYDAAGTEQLAVGSLGGWVRQISYAADGDRIRVVVGHETPEGGWVGDLKAIDTTTGATTVLRRGLVSSADPAGFPAASFSDDGSAVVAWIATETGPATWTDTAGGAPTRLQLEPRPVEPLGFVALPSGAAQLWADGAVTLYDRTGRASQVLDVHQQPVKDVVLAVDGSWAATTGGDGTVIIWDVDESSGTWSQRETLSGHSGDVTAGALSPDGRTLYTAGGDQSVIGWDMSADAGFGSSYPHLEDRWIANRPETVVPGRLVVAPTRPLSRLAAGAPVPADDTRTVSATFLDPATGRVVDQVRVGRSVEGAMFGSSVAVSPDGRMVAVTSALATTVLDTRTRERLGRVLLPPVGDELPHEPVWAAGWSRDGAQLLLGAEGDLDDGHDGGLVVVDPETWTVQRRVELGSNVQAIEQSPDGRVLAVGESPVRDLSGREVVQLLDAATLEPLASMRLTDDDFTHDLSFSPDGARLAVGGALGLLTVFDLEAGSRAHEPVKVQDHFVQQVEWTPDGQTVLASGADGEVALYDVQRDVVRAVPLPGSSDVATSADVVNGYTHLLPGTSAEVVALSGARSGHRYPMDPTVWLDEVCTIVGRDLTEAEWSRYVPERPYRQTCG